MSDKKLRDGVLSWLMPLCLFFVLSAGYFAPQFGGRTLPMHDIVQYRGMSRDIVEQRERTGTDPQWTGAMFSGMPAYMIDMQYPSAAVQRSVGRLPNLIGRPASLVFLAMVGFWVMLLLAGVRPWTAAVPAVAYGLSSYFFIIIGAGHLTKMTALVYAPMMLGGVFYAFRRNMWAGAGLTALFASLELGANHLQITYYFVLAMAFYWVSEGVRAVREHALPRFAKVTALLLAAGLLAVGSAFAPLWYAAQHTGDTVRGGSELAEAGSEGARGLDIEYATAWSYGRTESFNMFIPNLMGGESSSGFSSDGPVAQALSKYGARGMATQLPGYWGDQPMTAGPTYIGAAVFFFAVFALFALPRRRTAWIAAVSVLALLLAWGHNFMWFTELCFKILPGYDKFRTVSMTLVIVEWSVPLLAALGLAAVCDGGGLFGRPAEKAERCAGGNAVAAAADGVAGWKRAWVRALAVTGGVALFFALFGSRLFDFSAAVDAQLPEDVAAAMREERASMLVRDSWRSLLFVLLAAGALWGRMRGKLSRGLFLALAAAVVSLDLVGVNLRYLPQSKFVTADAAEIRPTAADLEILEDKELGFRVLNTTVSPFNDATTSYFHRSVGGYHGAKLARYQDLIDRYLGKGDMNAYNLLNTKYFIVSDPQTGAPVAELNPEANGAAWLVDEWRTAAGAREEIEALAGLDNKREAVVDERFAALLPEAGAGAPEGAIELVEYRPDYLKYRYSADRTSMGVFSEIYYDKGWTAWLDGEPAPYYRADYVLRAMTLPAGEHTVEWRFRAPAFGNISAVTLVCSVAILLGALASAAWMLLGKRWKTRRGGESELPAEPCE